MFALTSRRVIIEVLLKKVFYVESSSAHIAVWISPCATLGSTTYQQPGKMAVPQTARAGIKRKENIYLTRFPSSGTSVLNLIVITKTEK